jgi:hypothetical protein
MNVAGGVRKDEEFSGTRQVEERHRVDEANSMCGQIASRENPAVFSRNLKRRALLVHHRGELAASAGFTAASFRMMIIILTDEPFSFMFRPRLLVGGEVRTTNRKSGCGIS